MEAQPMYVKVSRDLAEDSEEFKNELQKELTKQGIQAEIKWTSSPVAEEADREVVLLILAIGATSVMVGTAVKRVLDGLNGGKQTIAVAKEKIPVIENGKPVLDRKGNQVYSIKETPVAFESSKADDSMSLNVLKVFEFKSASGKQADQRKSS